MERLFATSVAVHSGGHWLGDRAVCIGLDVLVDRYLDVFGEEMLAHRMIYLRTTETRIPLPTSFCDVMFSLNALDHVDNLARMCGEIARVMKPGADLFAEFNLYERRTVTEPQTLDPDLLDRTLLHRFDEAYRDVHLKPDGSEGQSSGPAPAILTFVGRRR